LATESSVSEERSLDVVIVSFRSAALLRSCLASLRLHPASAPVRIQVIDNASGDGTAEMLRREFPEVDLTVSQANAGFAAAANQAIAAGFAPYVLLLNPDTELADSVLDRLLAVMDEHPKVGICGPLLQQPSGAVDHAAARSFPTPLSSIGHFLNLSQRRHAPQALRGYAAHTDRGGPVDAVNGAFMLIRRQALEDVGAFDEGYWMYMEDLDLCYRMREAGWLTWFEPSVSSKHVKGGSTGPYRSLRLNYAFHHGMYRFYRKHYAAEHLAVVNAAVYVGITVKLAVSSVRSAVGRQLLRVGLLKR
jgi:N-acetylglucosaminyl-diphospho-decaprenol L-rhamnosyltransferase